MSMTTKTKIALVFALVLGGASAALANDMEPNGGFVVSGSMDGVNPAYHPGIFGNTATARGYGFVKTQQGVWETSPATQGDVR
jgi:hypothetical protein